MPEHKHEANPEHPPRRSLGHAVRTADAVNLPEHYARYKIEPISFIVENNLPFMEGNAVKYILRHDQKNGAEDIRKAIRYCEMILRRTYGKDPDWWRRE